MITAAAIVVIAANALLFGGFVVTHPDPTPPAAPLPQWETVVIHSPQ